MKTAQQILESIASRSAKSRWGIGVAAKYLRDLSGCFEGGFCPTKLFDGVSQDQWQRALKDAAERLTFCHPGLTVKAATGSYSAGSVLDFDAIVTTRKRDRDRDVLEPKGARPDPAMPLLWQHFAPQPIGKLVAMHTHTAAQVAGRFAIADLPLGRDAAVLVEFGALRISHGFNPIEFEPIGEKDGGGWHITEYEIMETSLVSVPSNTDAVITAFSRGKLAHPAVKGWAKHVSDKRPAKVAVGVSIMEDGKVVIDTKASQPAVAKCGGDCGCDACSHADEHDEAEKMADGVCTKCGFEAEKSTDAKAGRVLSGKNESQLADACEMLSDALEYDLPKPAKTLVKEADSLIRGVLAQLPKTDPVYAALENISGTAAEVTAKQAVEVLMDAGQQEMQDAHRAIGAKLVAVKRINELQELNRELAALGL